jgi:hypothetical protein
MSVISRRELLQKTAVAAAGIALLPRASTHAANAGKPDLSEKYVTCFYQFGHEALERFTENQSLPNGAGFLHIMSHSAPRSEGFAGRGKMVHDCGESFKWAPAFDLAAYEGWESADDATLKDFAKDYRNRVLDAKEAADYFAFNEMPPAASADEKVRGQVTKLIRYLNDAGGGPKLRGVFYLTEKNLDLATWKGTPAELFQAIDETCDLMVAEHYHSDAFVFGRTVEQFSEHLFALAKMMDQSPDPHAKNIARKKFCVLHSCYWGSGKMPGHLPTAWEGMIAPNHDPEDFEAYLHRCIYATRVSEFGKRRIAFSPLALKHGELGEKVYSMLAAALAQDARMATHGN